MKNFITNSKYKNLFILIFWIGVWQILAMIINQVLYLPSPVVTIKVLLKLMQTNDFYLSIGASILRIIAGFSLSCLLGVFLGLICGINKYAHDLFQPLIITLRTTPVISVVILALVWFKQDNVAIFVSFLICFPIIWTNTVSGIKSTDKKLLEMCKIFKIKKIRVIKTVYISSALPYIASGMISALGIGWKATAAAEVLSLPKYAIGHKLFNAKVYLETPELFAWTLVMILLSYVFEVLIKKLFNKVINNKPISNN